MLIAVLFILMVTLPIPLPKRILQNSCCTRFFHENVVQTVLGMGTGMNGISMSITVSMSITMNVIIIVIVSQPRTTSTT